MILDGETPGEEIPSGNEIKYKNENKFIAFEDNFNEEHNKKNNKNNQILKDKKIQQFYNDEYDIFFCKQKNNINEKECSINNELCKQCQEYNQAYHKLKKNYLLNSAGRVCTFRKGKMLCLGKFQRVLSEKTINYLLDLTCNGIIQCEPCKRIEENMEKYYEPALKEAILRRDKKLGY